MSIVSKLSQLEEIKQNIKQAIISKGQPVANDMTKYAAAIRNIETGETPTTPPKYPVQWLDYNGTVLKEELLSPGETSTKPADPSHPPYIRFLGWDEGNSVTMEDHPIYCIAHYEATNDDKIIIKYETVFENEVHRVNVFRSTATTANKFSIDWGDGTVEQLGTSSESMVCEHTYRHVGTYIVEITRPATGSFALGHNLSTSSYTSARCDFTEAFFGKNTAAGSGAFDRNGSLRGVVLPNNMTETYNYSFTETSNLKCVYLPDTVRTIGEGTFRYARNLKKISNLQNITTIKNFAFAGCFKLEQPINIPNLTTLGTSNVGDGVFSGCYSLRKVVSLGNITDLRQKAFYFCVGLESITLPQTLTAIHPYALQGCATVTSMNLPISLTSIGIEAFRYCYLWKGEINLPNLVTLGSTENSFVFQYCMNLKKISNLGNVTYIPHYCFAYCDSLEECVIPDSVTEINAYAFSECHHLKTVTWGANIQSIGVGAFQYCRFLESDINLPNLTSLGGTTSNSYTFGDCKRLKKVINLGSITHISRYCFNGCNQLETINLPESLTTIGSYAFNGCSSLQDFELPESVTSIEANAFQSCKTFTSIFIPDGCSIGGYAFNECLSLSYVSLPQYLVAMPSTTFTSCYRLRIIDVADGLVFPANVSFNSSSVLSEAAMVGMFNNLGETSTTINIALGSTNLARLTAVERAIATDKGYTLSN